LQKLGVFRGSSHQGSHLVVGAFARAPDT